MGRSSRGRATIKSTELLALFIIGFFGAMFCCLMIVIVKPILDYILGR